MKNTVPWSPEVEALFEHDLTTEFNTDDYHIDAQVIADSINPETGKRITTLAIKIPRIILAEHNTHRCLTGDTVVKFADPAYNYTLEQVYQQWSERNPIGDVCFYNPQTQMIETTTITNVWMTGEKPTKILTTVDGQTIQGSYDHLVYTNNGWKELQHIIVGEDQVFIVNGDSNVCCSIDVKSVVEGGVRMLYDIEVQDENHNFFANNIVVHNCLSRNFSSSRAIPANKLRKEAWSHPFVPVYWGANKSGMSADQQLTGFKLSMAKFSWKLAGKFAVMFHKLMECVGVHKQTCNRIIEPWMSVVGTVTSTEWDNFLRLRYDHNAQPEIIILAKKIHDAIKNSTPVVPADGVHLPFIDQQERDQFTIDQLIKISVARCCRTSYANCLGKKSQPEEDIKLYDRLLGNGHFSPFEHIAFVPKGMGKAGRPPKDFQADMQRNFRGWYQLRAFIQPESNTKYLSQMYNINL